MHLGVRTTTTIVGICWCMGGICWSWCRWSRLRVVLRCRCLVGCTRWILSPRSWLRNRSAAASGWFSNRIIGSVDISPGVMRVSLGRRSIRLWWWLGVAIILVTCGLTVTRRVTLATWLIWLGTGHSSRWWIIHPLLCSRSRLCCIHSIHSSNRLIECIWASVVHYYRGVRFSNHLVRIP